MATIASKNLYELLGNDADQDPDRAPPAPVKVVDKPVQRTGKRNAAGADPTIDPLRPSAGRGGARDGVNNREQGDRPARNREPREYRGGEGRGEGRGRGRGRGRGGRGGAPRDDRHSHTGINEHEKQAAHGWGAETGTAEWADEKAGEAIATAEANNDSGFTPDTSGADPAFTNGPGAAGEAVNDDAVAEEDNTKSYDQYLAEQAEKRLAISQTLSVRKANEGSKQQFPEGKAFSRESEDFIAAAAGKARKAKEAQDKKERLTLDGQYYQAADSGDRGGRGGRGGGRGGARGGRGGEFRGERGGRGGRGRGEPRGGARGDRGESRPERGGARGGFNATDESAFPALGRS